MKKATKPIVIILAFIIILSLTFSAGCVFSNDLATNSSQGLEKVNEVWNIIFRDYVEKDKLDAGKLSEGAIKGILDVLDDPHTAYVNADEYRFTMDSLQGNFGGIGARVSEKDGKIIIVAPFEGSPAEKAGIRTGDIILKINDTSTEGLDIFRTVLLVRGPLGTSVKLLIQHENETEPVEIEIIRAEIEIDSVSLNMRDDIAYIRISEFSERTGEEFSQALQEITQKGTKGIIIDLRYNLGGRLEGLTGVASQLLKEGVILHVVNNQGRQSTISVTPVEFVTDLPIVVLVNQYSASASEALSGALQDHNRATIAGTTTFGKGSVNVLNPLKDGSGLYLTVARWLTPKGNAIEGKGITPDQTLEMEGEDAVQWALDFLKGKKS